MGSCRWRERRNGKLQMEREEEWEAADGIEREEEWEAADGEGGGMGSCRWYREGGGMGAADGIEREEEWELQMV
jgi:hypothetical protein